MAADFHEPLKDHVQFGSEVFVQNARLRAAGSSARAERYCRRLVARRYENFTVASHSLPRRLRPHFCNIYAYCRMADDLADENPDAAENLARLDLWEAQLRACYAGHARHPVFLALERTVREFAIPMRPFTDLLLAFRRDQQSRPYESIEELFDYCRHSANPVGRMVLYLAGRPEAQLARWSDSVCTGLQLANLWQDLAEDVRRGRLYLPRDIRRAHGYTDSMLETRESNDRFRAMIRGEAERARRLLEAGLPLIERGPPALRIQIALFIQGGIAILKRIGDIDYDVWRVRPRLGPIDRLSIMAKALWLCSRTGWRESRP